MDGEGSGVNKQITILQDIYLPLLYTRPYLALSQWIFHINFLPLRFNSCKWRRPVVVLPTRWLGASIIAGDLPSEEFTSSNKANERVGLWHHQLELSLVYRNSCELDSL